MKKMNIDSRYKKSCPNAAPCRTAAPTGAACASAPFVLAAKPRPTELEEFMKETSRARDGFCAIPAAVPPAEDADRAAEAKAWYTFSHLAWVTLSNPRSYEGEACLEKMAKKTRRVLESIDEATIRPREMWAVENEEVEAWFEGLMRGAPPTEGREREIVARAFALACARDRNSRKAVSDAFAKRQAAACAALGAAGPRRPKLAYGLGDEQAAAYVKAAALFMAAQGDPEAEAEIESMARSSCGKLLDYFLADQTRPEAFPTADHVARPMAAAYAFSGPSDGAKRGAASLLAAFAALRLAKGLDAGRLALAVLDAETYVPQAPTRLNEAKATLAKLETLAEETGIKRLDRKESGIVAGIRAARDGGFAEGAAARDVATVAEAFEKMTKKEAATALAAFVETRAIAAKRGSDEPTGEDEEEEIRAEAHDRAFDAFEAAARDRQDRENGAAIRVSRKKKERAQAFFSEFFRVTAALARGMGESEAAACVAAEAAEGAAQMAAKLEADLEAEKAAHESTRRGMADAAARERAKSREDAREAKSAAEESARTIAKLKKTVAALEAELAEKNAEIADLQAQAWELAESMADERDDDEGEPKQEVREMAERLNATVRGVVIGGHHTHRRRLEAYLPDWKFYPTEVIAPQEAIQHAQVVAFSVQHLSHATFERVSSIARRAGVEIAFLKDRNAESAVRQLAEKYAAD